MSKHYACVLLSVPAFSAKHARLAMTTFAGQVLVICASLEAGSGAQVRVGDAQDSGNKDVYLVEIAVHSDSIASFEQALDCAELVARELRLGCRPHDPTIVSMGAPLERNSYATECSECAILT